MEQAFNSLLEQGVLGVVTAILFAFIFWNIKRQDKKDSDTDQKWRETVEKISFQHNESLTSALDKLEKAHEKSGDKISQAIERALADGGKHKP